MYNADLIKIEKLIYRGKMQEKPMKLRICPECGTELPKESRFCDICGQKLLTPIPQMRIFLICFLFALLASGVLDRAQISYRTFINNSYQHATCITTDEEVTIPSGRNSHGSIDIEVTYDLITSTGEYIRGHSTIQTYDFADAETQKNAYQVGNTYDCWYSAVSTAPTRILREDQTTYLLIWIFSPFYVLFFFIVSYSIYQFIYQPWRFFRKGVRVEGTVIKKEWKSHSYTSFVSFQTMTNPPIECKVIIPGRYREGRRIALIYDSRHPQEHVQQNNKSGEKSNTQFIIHLASIVAILSGLMLLIFATVGFFLM